VDSLLLELDPGEAEAIVLAAEMRADLLLLDERRCEPWLPVWGLSTSDYWESSLTPSAKASSWQ
jgi:hypothetical protein